MIENQSKNLYLEMIKNTLHYCTTILYNLPKDVVDNKTKESLTVYGNDEGLRSNLNPSKMNDEAERLTTFDGRWPLEYISEARLAKLGCYYTGPFDKVKCHFCAIELGLWEEGDNELIEHQRWSPDCPLLNRSPTDNIPVDATELDNLLPHSISFDVCGLNTTLEFRRSSFVENNSSLHPTDSVGNLPSASTSSESGGAVYPQYAVEVKRLESFKAWPRGIKITPEDLSDAGFFYTGQSDLVRCFSCGGGLKDWVETDIPWEQHALFLSSCKFLKLVKGQSYIDEVIAKYRDVDSEPIQEAVREYDQEIHESASTPTAEGESKLCKICYDNEKDTVFAPCGHTVCGRCASAVTRCPICRAPFETVIRFYL